MDAKEKQLLYNAWNEAEEMKHDELASAFVARTMDLHERDIKILKLEGFALSVALEAGWDIEEAREVLRGLKE